MDEADKKLDQLMRRTGSALAARLEEALDFEAGLLDIQERAQ